MKEGHTGLSKSCYTGQISALSLCRTEPLCFLEETIREEVDVSPHITSVFSLEACSKCQRWIVTKYIYSGTVLKYNFEVSVLYLSISVS